jgi:hypothetical protein
VHDGERRDASGGQNDVDQRPASAMSSSAQPLECFQARDEGYRTISLVRTPKRRAISA